MSAAPKFTPGPWEWAPVGNGFFLRTPDRGLLVVMDMVRRAGMIGSPRFAIMSDDEPRGRRGGILRDVDPSTHPDGRLIAAAPEIYERLMDARCPLCSTLVDKEPGRNCGWCAETRAVLAKVHP